MRNVTTVVEVLIMSCQVSEKPNKGPVHAHTTTQAAHMMNANGLPAAADTAFANFVNILLIDQIRMRQLTTVAAHAMT
jgi:hypothetical protein